MSAMNFLDKLLDGVAVEWKTLGESIKLEKGKQLNKDLLSEHGLYPAYNGGISHSGFTDTYNYAENTIIISQGGASAGFVNYVTSKFYANAHCYIVRPKTEVVESRYVYHLLKLNQERLTNKQHGAGIPALRTSEILEIPIPIPCPGNPKKSLEIQAEIVRILDTFTELTNELNARKKQYNYYRDQLLSFEDGDVEWKPLGEIGEFIRGKRFTKADYVESGIPVIHYGEIYTRYGVFTACALSQIRSDIAEVLRYAEPGDIVIAGVGETVEDVGKAVAWIGSNKVAIHDDSYAFRHSMNPKFISYVMQTAKFIDEKAKHVARGKVNRLLMNGIAKVSIPIPYPNDVKKSLAEQARIVAILDKFDMLTNSISEGLPREIELCHKQYEYYRDLLLSFPKPDSEVAA
ncbi:restriction endonuclease subunit S [Dickeya dadantii subsp. dieffenbachiae]|uniref:restriction endonuclease subunit S n=1 Tax=Dickeya dadantii TaxID=204038 RepID=UPI0006ACC369|nr:restriction endonuclease subunit S [Dickeya dadantii]